MTPEEKLKIALDLYYSAKALKASALRSFNKNMSEEKIQKKVKDTFLYAGT